MDKRYQVFISSTFQDLQAERQAVSKALLKSHCFPAQMENWPAMDAEQMEAIKEIIDESDYFIVISAGKYGSTSSTTGLSYTEMEYDYAVNVGKPVIRLLHENPFGALRGDQIEESDEGRSKLRLFHDKLRATRICKSYRNADQLEAETVLALMDIQRRKPVTGWVRADGRATQEAELLLAEQGKRIAELERDLSQAANITFDPESRFRSIEITKSFSGTGEIPLRDLCFLFLACAFSSYERSAVIRDASRQLNSSFEGFSFVSSNAAHWDWVPIELEAAGLIQIEGREIVAGDKIMTRDTIKIRPETRIWLAQKIPFNEPDHFTILIPS